MAIDRLIEQRRASRPMARRLLERVSKLQNAQIISMAPHDLQADWEAGGRESRWH